jgi:exodeoxyribonuclease VII small subunit
MAKKTKPDEPSYEDAVDRIEELIDAIESGEIGLDESLKAFEEGMGLIKTCRARLEKAEQRVSELLAEEDGGGGDSPDS